MKHGLTLLLALLVCLGGLPAFAGEELRVPRVEGLTDDFFLGMDVSSALSLERSGVTWKDEDGRERDLFELLSERGVNLIRLRVWNDPFDAEGHGYGGGNCDLATAIALGRRATSAGMRVLIDFHYSDFWADPGKQMTPKAWREITDIKEKSATLGAWTRESLLALRDAGVDVAMVQLGNETNGMLCGEKRWMDIYYLMDAGSGAVREVFPQALIAVHFSDPQDADSYLSWAFKLDYYHLDYDVFGTSYYPYWHGSLENLKATLGEIQATYGKQVMVLETSWAWTTEDGDFSGNTIGESGYDKPYAISVQGQVNEVAAVAQAMADIGGIGLCYWEGAWVPVGRFSREENAALWEAYGSGWASSYAAEYDPDDAGQYYGGCACDNQALFDFDGRALASLSVFSLLREGREATLKADALDDAFLECDIHGAIELPETVDAVMSDNSRKAVAVTWEETDIEALRAAGPGTTVIHGEAEGLPAVLTLKLSEFNYVQNPSFEEDDVSMWRAVDRAGAPELRCEEKANDSLTGARHWHFYSDRARGVDFDLEQELQGVPAGVYSYKISVMGGDAGDSELYSYVLVNGECVATMPTQITSWKNWFTPEIRDISVRDGDTVTIGIHVRCDGAGAWGKIDDAEFCAQGD